MKTQLLTGALALALMMGSCTKEPNETETSRAINFNGKINELLALAPGGSPTMWMPNDNIGIFMVDKGTTNVRENSQNRKYVYDGVQFLPALGNEIYFPVNNSKVDFIAYYPYKVDYSLNTPITFSVVNQSNLSNIDLLYAKSNNSGAGYSKTGSTNIPLSFDHKLSKIIINPVAGNGLNTSDPSWTNMSVHIQGMYTSCNFDLRTGVISSPGLPLPLITFTRIPGTTYEAIVIPYEYTIAGSFSLLFIIDGNSYVLSSPANERFEAGKEYTYTVSINKTGIALNSVVVNDWTPVYRSGVAN